MERGSGISPGTLCLHLPTARVVTALRFEQTVFYHRGPWGHYRHGWVWVIAVPGATLPPHGNAWVAEQHELIPIAPPGPPVEVRNEQKKPVTA